MSEIADKVRGYLLDHLLPDTDPEELTDETELIATRILDSLSILGLRAFLEEEYGIEIAAHELDAENFATVAAVERLVAGRLASERGSG